MHRFISLAYIWSCGLHARTQSNIPFISVLHCVIICHTLCGCAFTCDCINIHIYLNVCLVTVSANLYMGNYYTDICTVRTVRMYVYV